MRACVCYSFWAKNDASVFLWLEHRVVVPNRLLKRRDELLPLHRHDEREAYLGNDPYQRKLGGGGPVRGISAVFTSRRAGGDSLREHTEPSHTYSFICEVLSEVQRGALHGLKSLGA